MRGLWFIIGWLALIIGGIGILLPVMPTVPFLLVAAWAFTKSSPELRERIRQHPRFGPTVRAWQDRNVVPPTAKVWAVFAMAFGVGLSLWLGLPPLIIAAQATICAAVGLFIVTRPSA